MEDGRVIEVATKMRSGTGKKRNKKNRNPWNTPSSESELEKSSSTDEIHQHQTQEELQRMVTQTMEQRGMLGRFVEVMAIEKERRCSGGTKLGCRRNWEEVYVAASRTAIEKAVRERGNEMGKMRKIELIREGSEEEVLSGKQQARGCP